MKKYIVICGIKSVIISQKNLILNQSTIRLFLKTNIRSNSYGAIDFNTKKTPEAGSNYIFWLVMLIDTVPKKNKNYY